jgi:hypothetical protein
VPVLRAQLQDREGNWIHRDVNLAERIENRNGAFYFDGKTGSIFFIKIDRKADIIHRSANEPGDQSITVPMCPLVRLCYLLC